MLVFLPIFLLFPFKCDFSLRRESFRFKAMFKMFSNNKQPIFEWILFHSVENTLPGSELIKINKKNNNKFIALFSLLFVIPLYFFRILLNYFKLRLLMLKILLSLMLNNHSKIKILSC